MRQLLLFWQGIPSGAPWTGSMFRTSSLEGAAGLVWEAQLCKAGCRAKLKASLLLNGAAAQGLLCLPLGRAQQAVERPVSLQAPKKIRSGEMEMFFQYLKYDHSERVPISANFWHGPAHVRHCQ